MKSSDFQYDEHHLSYGYGTLEDHEVNDSDFLVRINSPRRELKSLREELLISAQQVVNLTSKELIVAFSGGYDSQLALISLKLIGAPFKALTEVYTYKGCVINQLDVENAIRFTKRHRIQHFFNKIDLKYWYDACIPIAQKTHFINPHIAIRYRTFNQYPNAFIINAEGNPVITINDSQELVSEYYSDISDIVKESLGDGMDCFLGYTPELYFANLVHPAVINFSKCYRQYYDFYAANSKTPHWYWRVFSYYIKPLVIADNFDEVDFNYKLTGFEDFELDDEYKSLYHSFKPRNYPDPLQFQFNDLVELSKARNTYCIFRQKVTIK